MMRTTMYSRLARAVLVAGLFISACENDSTGPVQPRGTVAQVEFNGTRPELYLQDMSGSGRQRIHFDGAVDPFPENSPLVPRFEDAKLRALGPLHWSADGTRLALVGAVAFDQSQVVILDASGS